MRAIVGVEVIGRGAGAELFQHVVEAGQRQVRDARPARACDAASRSSAMARMLCFCVSFGVREGERVEAAGFGVARIVANAEPSACAQSAQATWMRDDSTPRWNASSGAIATSMLSGKTDSHRGTGRRDAWSFRPSRCSGLVPTLAANPAVARRKATSRVRRYRVRLFASRVSRLNVSQEC